MNKPTKSLGVIALVVTVIMTIATASVLAVGGADSAHDESTLAAAPSVPHEHGTHDNPVAGSDTGHGPRDIDAVWDAATPDERAGATSLIETTEAAVARYRDVNVALADGFRPNPNQHGRLVHYPSARNRRDNTVLDRNRPEGLVYARSGDGTMQLVAALYTATGGENPPAPGGDITMWHSHTPGCAHPAEDPGCEDAVRMYMLHVWLFDGANDPFADSFHAARAAV